MFLTKESVYVVGPLNQKNVVGPNCVAFKFWKLIFKPLNIFIDPPNCSLNHSKVCEHIWRV
jgi:hypothetical protein